MNWKDSFLGACFAALYLAVPSSVVPAVAEILPEGAEESEQMLPTAGTQSLPLGHPRLSELRTSTPVTPGLTHTVIVRGKRSNRNFTGEDGEERRVLGL